MTFELFLLILSAAVCLITCVSILDLTVGIRSMTRLSEVSPYRDGEVRVSVIVPACNEADNIEQAMRTLLRQDYEHYEIIAVNDRSTDNTGTILDRLSLTERRLRVLHLDRLPDGWMGKMHALSRGAAEAAGDYLLFTDADIMMDSTTIARAVHRMEARGLAHLTLLFKNSSPGWLLNSLILDAGSGLCQVLRPWAANKPGSRFFVGIGAFNMVRRDVYEATGGHDEIKMHPVDDIMLGKNIKKKGYSQECLLGYDMVTVPWYASVGHMVEGLMKNVLAIINFRFLLIPPSLFVMFALNILHLWGVLLLQGTPRLLFSLTLAAKIIAFYAGTRLLAISPWCTLGTLISPYITVYIIVRAAWKNGRDGGIYWRGTFYSLKELRKNSPLFL
jgi:cellulose synthase/poly-beta-1,6-N-acetylglucosamine synthase-like glycosyltransferase